MTLAIFLENTKACPRLSRWKTIFNFREAKTIYKNRGGWPRAGVMPRAPGHDDIKGKKLYHDDVDIDADADE